jgi:hypothetical protein
MIDEVRSLVSGADASRSREQIIGVIDSQLIPLSRMAAILGREPAQ